MIISFSISDPSQIAYTVSEEQHEAINNNWGNQEAWGNEDGWNHTDDWNEQETQPQPNPNSIPLSGLIGCSTT